MLISEEKGFLYYHLYKVAGTSIRNSLLPYCSRRVAAMQNINYGLRTFGIKIIDNPLYQFHPDLNDVKSLLGEEFYKYYRFTFVREPLDWQKSLYFFLIIFNSSVMVICSFSFNICNEILNLFSAEWIIFHRYCFFTAYFLKTFYFGSKLHDNSNTN